MNPQTGYPSKSSDPKTSQDLNHPTHTSKDSKPHILYDLAFPPGMRFSKETNKIETQYNFSTSAEQDDSSENTSLPPSNITQRPQNNTQQLPLSVELPSSTENEHQIKVIANNR